MTTVASKVVVSIVNKDMPLDSCPLGTHVFIVKDSRNKYDDKALSALVKHKKTGKWTFIGYVAANENYIPIEGIDNAKLHDLLDTEKMVANGRVVDKMPVIFPYGQEATALIVEIKLR